MLRTNAMKEVAAIKCIIDFRIAYYTMVGRDPNKYLKAATQLHKDLTSHSVSVVNSIIKLWTVRLPLQ